MQCKTCGSQLPPGASFCSTCGTQAGPEGVQCPRCGQQFPVQPPVCANCGFQFIPPVSQPVYGQKSRMAAGILGILLGSLGIHNFYLGFTQRALIQLLVSIIGGFLSFGIASFGMGVWGLVEGIFILTGDPRYQRDAMGVPLKD
ncbi:TM2 domain-containing protein [Oscillospiraceae bacterium MB08-C2-2]|nr:TM2 domain-containing protein [Oscillospiraceae bacterium MB08-C2-2]